MGQDLKDDNNSTVPEPAGTRNRRVIKELYKALAGGETAAAAKYVASDLEWWFHGPPESNHMMRILTGDLPRQNDHFKFKPRRAIALLGDRVIVEGWEGSSKGYYWVHVWTLKDGIATQFREYFDTWLTVILRVSDDGKAIRLWQSEPRLRLGRSLPDLVLAI